MEIKADYFDGKSAKKHEVTLQFSKEGIKIKEFNLFYPKEQITISSRLGNIPRVITFFDHSRCKVKDNDALDAILKENGYSQSLLYKLEKSYKVVIIGLTFIVLFTIYLLTYGADAIAKKIAYATPNSITQKISKESFSFLDKNLLSKSNLTKEKKEKIEKLFKKLTNNNPKYHLHFRSSPKIGANAFALPNGDIVLLDELVFLDKDKDLRGIEGVLAHEIGHVYYRHGLQSIIKGAIATALISYISGDFSFIVTLPPTLLITNAYSREFEKEADYFAKKKMKELHESTLPLANLFKNLQKFYHLKEEDQFKAFLSTHPLSKKRILFFENKINSED